MLNLCRDSLTLLRLPVHLVGVLQVKNLKEVQDSGFSKRAEPAAAVGAANKFTLLPAKDGFRGWAVIQRRVTEGDDGIEFL